MRNKKHTIKTKKNNYKSAKYPQCCSAEGEMLLLCTEGKYYEYYYMKEYTILYYE